MASGSGPSLGAAVHDLLRVSPKERRSTRQQLSYVTAKTTGASVASVARQLGVPRDRVRIWISGKTAPNAVNRNRIEQLFDRFWEINNRAAPGRNPGNRMLRVTGPITVNGNKRTSVIIEKGEGARDWETLRTTSAEEISERGGPGNRWGWVFLKAMGDPIPYLQFPPGKYTIAVL